MGSTTLVTPSFAPDFHRCEVLVQSVKKFVTGYDRHVLIVPKRDELLFSPLAGDGCEIILAENMLPKNLWQLPFFNRYWMHGIRPSRGWILQQVLKLAFASQTESDGMLLVDSDITFVKNFDVNTLWRGDSIRLYCDERKPQFYKSIRYKNWYRFASKLTQLEEPDIDRAYIAQLNSMHTENVLKLMHEITHFYQTPWQEVLIHTLDFSEHILYGVFVDKKLNDANHWLDSGSICHSSWFDEINNTEDLKTFFNHISDREVAFNVQSNLGIEPEEYMFLIDNLE